MDNRYKQSLLSCYYVKSCTSTLISPDIFNAEFDNLKEIFLKLKYPEGLVNSMINRFIESQDQEQALIDIQVNKSIQIILP